MLYKINIHHEDGYYEDKYTNDFEVTERLIKTNVHACLAWVTEFKLNGDVYVKTPNVWKYEKVDGKFNKAEYTR